MNLLAHRALLADHKRSRRARVREALPGELPGSSFEQLRSAEWFARIFEASPVGMVLSTLAEGWIFDVNDRFLDLLGTSRADVLGRTATELGIWVGLSEGHIVRMLSRAGRLRRAEVRFRTSSGELRDGLLSVERLRLGDTEALLSLLDDVTDQRHLRARCDRLIESERRARAEAEEALEQLRRSHERLESLSRRVVDLQETERRALARELHDEVGQVLAGLKFQLERVATRLPVEVESILAQLSSRVRDLSMDLLPPMLEAVGLLPTLLWHFERYHAQTGVRVAFRPTPPVGRLPPQVETAAFRIVQEALTNVARHAGVREARVELDVHPDRLVLRVEDRGAGFVTDEAWAGASNGLSGMRDRARLAGGRLAVESGPGAGARVTAELPRTAAEGRTG